MDIILFRHSIAEKWTEAYDDFSRKLTVKGRKKAQTKACLLREKLAAYKSVAIWSSPLVRAVQTAKILGETLGCANIEIKDYIASGEISLLCRDLQNTDRELVIVTGHAPHLDIWCERISGEFIKLRKSGFVWISLDELDPPRGKVKQIDNDKD